MVYCTLQSTQGGACAGYYCLSMCSQKHHTAGLSETGMSFALAGHAAQLGLVLSAATYSFPSIRGRTRMVNVAISAQISGPSGLGHPDPQVTYNSDITPNVVLSERPHSKGTLTFTHRPCTDRTTRKYSDRLQNVQNRRSNIVPSI